MHVVYNFLLYFIQWLAVSVNHVRIRICIDCTARTVKSGLDKHDYDHIKQKESKQQNKESIQKVQQVNKQYII